MINIATKFESQITIEYIQRVLNDYKQDNNKLRANRRLRIKEVHLVRKGKPQQAKVVENVRRLL